MSTEKRVSVKTSVPESQKRAWREHADTLDMSQSEFVRTMIQAGRRGFELDPPETGSPDGNPRGNALRKPVLDALSTDEYREFDEIVELLTDEFERLVDDSLDSVRDEGLVEHSGRKGGYRLMGGTDGGH